LQRHPPRSKETDRAFLEEMALSRLTLRVVVPPAAGRYPEQLVDGDVYIPNIMREQGILASHKEYGYVFVDHADCYCPNTNVYGVMAMRAWYRRYE
jgi:hypothetical protein